MRSLPFVIAMHMSVWPVLAGVQFDVSKVAPDASSGASSLESVPTQSGADLYYLVRDGALNGGEELWVSNDNGMSWSYPDLYGIPGLPNGPTGTFFGGTGEWMSNLLRYHPGLGTQGGLILKTVDLDPDPYGQFLHRMVWYDIANPSWNWLGDPIGAATVIGNGAVVVGDYYYGIWHAGGGNFGGPIARVNVLNPGEIDERTVLSGVSGADSGWYSRAAQLTEVGGLIYGIKNDWATPQPQANPGDRLFTIDPNSFTASLFAGGNPWVDTNWQAQATPATDLGTLPFEPGSGSCLVGLPANWSSEIGAQGGLFLIAGESPSNQEGWAEPSPLYALYDIASATFTVHALPGAVGTGTSAVLHDGDVYIKRGQFPDGNLEIWVASGTSAPPCTSQETLQVESSPIAGVAIGVIPTDCNGNADAATPFSRSFTTGEFVSLTAPPVQGYRFVEWDVDGFFATSSATVVVEMSAARTATAVYALRCETPVPFTVQSAPVTAVTVAYSPASCDALTSGSTPFVRDFGDGETVTFVAPCVAGYTFVKWTVDGSDASTSPTLVLTLGTQTLAEAVYEPAAAPYIDGCRKFTTVSAPGDSSFASSLASDGTYLYYARRDSYDLYRTADACAWTALRRSTDDLGGNHGDWMSGALAYYAGAGAQGSLILPHRDSKDNNVKIARYDIAQNSWTLTATFTVGGHGSTVLGDYRYGIWHAGGANYGGPLTRVDLTQPNRIIDDRTYIAPSLTGNDPHWLSRAACVTALNGRIYGIKNDWYTNPAGTGDRLYRIDPANWASAVWSGTSAADYWNSSLWSANATPAADLGPLPFEPGYGSAIVALPPGWSCDVGAQGGLFVIAGRSPSNHEGWGDASAMYAVYDVASATWTTGTLPGATGSGTSATLHRGKVYIKRGGNPDAPYNAELWIVERATVAADFDGDGDVDVADFVHFQACFNGPDQRPAAAGCSNADIDGDNDVDVADFVTFQACFNGPDQPPAC